MDASKLRSDQHDVKTKHAPATADGELSIVIRERGSLASEQPPPGADDEDLLVAEEALPWWEIGVLIVGVLIGLWLTTESLYEVFRILSASGAERLTPALLPKSTLHNWLAASSGGSCELTRRRGCPLVRLLGGCPDESNAPFQSIVGGRHFATESATPGLRTWLFTDAYHIFCLTSVGLEALALGLMGGMRAVYGVPKRALVEILTHSTTALVASGLLLFAMAPREAAQGGRDGSAAFALVEVSYRLVGILGVCTSGLGVRLGDEEGLLAGLLTTDAHRTLAGGCIAISLLCQCALLWPLLLWRLALTSDRAAGTLVALLLSSPWPVQDALLGYSLVLDWRRRRAAAPSESPHRLSRADGAAHRRFAFGTLVLACALHSTSLLAGGPLLLLPLLLLLLAGWVRLSVLPFVHSLRGAAMATAARASAATAKMPPSPLSPTPSSSSSGGSHTGVTKLAIAQRSKLKPARTTGPRPQGRSAA